MCTLTPKSSHILLLLGLSLQYNKTLTHILVCSFQHFCFYIVIITYSSTTLNCSYRWKMFTCRKQIAIHILVLMQIKMAARRFNDAIFYLSCHEPFAITMKQLSKVNSGKLSNNTSFQYIKGSDIS